MLDVFGVRSAFRACRRAAAGLVKGSAPYRSYRNTRQFPGLGMDASVNREIEGQLFYGQQCSIGLGCNIIVPKAATLRLGQQCYVGRYVELGPSGSIAIGDRTSIQDRCTLVGDVRVGRYCILSLNIMMASGIHTFKEWPQLLIRDQEALLSTPEELARNSSRQINIEDDCWLGANSVVMPGVTVGRGCVVGANAVVTRDLPPYVVVGGAPARVIGIRFEFAPPREIDWSNLNDIPYFYRGFKLAHDERRSAQLLDGHVALESFAIWLGAAPGGKVVLKMRSSAGTAAIKSGNGEEVVVDDRWSSHAFDQADASSPMSFTSRGGQVIINRAWTE